MVELLNALPMLLTYFVPGYMFLWVKSRVNDERKKDNVEMFFLAIMATFIINLIASYIAGTHVGNSIAEVVGEGFTSTNIIAIAIAILGGLCVGLLSKSETMACVKSKLNIKSTPHASAWNAATSYPAWVTVYMDSINVAYTGKVIYTTCNPNIDKRELYLKNYKVYDTAEGTMLSDHNDDCEGVFIDCRDVTRIEFQHDKAGGI